MRRLLMLVPCVLMLALAGCPKPDGPGGTDVPPPPPPAGGSSWTLAGADIGRTASTNEPGPQALPGIAWTNPVAKEMLSEPVFGKVGGKDAVLLGSQQEVLAFELATGKPVWNYAAPMAVTASPLVAGGSVWTMLLDGLVHQLSAQDGKLAKELEFDFTLEASPLAVGDSVVFEETSMSSQVTDSRLHCIDAKTGAESWHFDFQRGTARAPSSDGTRVFAAAYDGVHAVNLKDGTKAWSHAFPLVVRVYSPVVADGAVIVAHGGYEPGFLTVLDAATGAPRWSKQLAARIGAAPAVAGGEILIPLMDAKVHRYSLKDGAELEALDPGARTDARPAISAHRVYVATGQTVVAFDRATMKEAWRLELESIEVSPAGIVHLAVMGSKLLVVRLDGNFHALEAAGGA